MSPRSLIHDHSRESQRLSNLNRVWQAQGTAYSEAHAVPVIVPVFKSRSSRRRHVFSAA